MKIHRISFAIVLALVLALAWRWTASAATTWPTTHDAFVRSDVAPLRDGGAAEALWVMASFQQVQLAQIRLRDRAEMSMRAIPGVTWTGYVDAILGDRSSVRIVLDPWQKTDRLHPGMAVVATIETEQ